MEMGADVVKLNLPKPDPDKDKDSPAPYNELRGLPGGGGAPGASSSAGRSLVVLSGGSKIDDDKLLEQTRYIMEAGGSGVIYGRNVWQREWSRGARDHRADQGDHALQRPPDPLASRFRRLIATQSEPRGWRVGGLLRGPRDVRRRQVHEATGPVSICPSAQRRLAPLLAGRRRGPAKLSREARR